MELLFNVVPFQLKPTTEMFQVSFEYGAFAQKRYGSSLEMEAHDDFPQSGGEDL